MSLNQATFYYEWDLVACAVNMDCVTGEWFSLQSTAVWFSRVMLFVDFSNGK